MYIARNRFNIQRAGTLGAASKSTTESNQHDNDVIDSTTTARSIGRPRPSFATRSRSKPNAGTTSSAPAAAPTTEESPSSLSETGATDHKLGTAGRPSRFNLGRPNRLLTNRQRPGVKATPSVRSEETSVEVTNSEATATGGELEHSPSASSVAGDSEVENSTPALTGLNRLKQRPRIQVQSGTVRPKTAAVAATPINTSNRKVNPLIARRKLGVSTSTSGIYIYSTL